MTLTRMQQRRGTTQEWANANPVLLDGEIGVDTTLDRIKVGDGVHTWLDLVFNDPFAETAAQVASDAASAAAAAAEAKAVATGDLDPANKALIEDETSETAEALSASIAGLADAGSTGPELLRPLFLSGQVTPSRPGVVEGDSHAGGGNAPEFCTRQINFHGLGGGPLEGLVASSVLPSLGNDGMTLAQYLNGEGATTFDEVTALNPSVAMLDCGTNDIRLGALGTTVTAIAAALTPLYLAWIDKRRKANPSAVVGFRLSHAYTTVPTALLTVDPQVASTAMRLAVYTAALARPGAFVYDPQVRVFGLTSPTSNGLWYADAIHLNIDGYGRMADDFAEWVGATRPALRARITQALLTNPSNPWQDYYRAVEDPSRYVRTASWRVIEVGDGYFRVGPANPDDLTYLTDLPDNALFEFMNSRATVARTPGSAVAGSGNVFVQVAPPANALNGLMHSYKPR